MAALALALIVGLNVANIIGRFVFLAPIMWAEEVMMYLLTLSVFAGLSAMTLSDRQIKMELVIGRLPPLGQKVTNSIALFCLIGVSLYITFWTAPLIERFYRYGQLSDAAQISIAISQAIVPAGFLTAAVAALIRLRLIWSSSSAVCDVREVRASAAQQPNPT
ncbi:TRAP transporter small permease [Hyphomicrobium sp. MC1]|uniref:TRAP transporter small permease n=1 Tax=Hyphomicrobium sp. (strain MC1) TaxID=717785 RepID=UPI0002E3539F|nr:TRAP transporter small permease [Hyphomicrobium sp. MC1]